MYKYIGCKIEAFTHKCHTFKHITCKIEVFTYKYNAFKYIGDKVKLLHTISSSLMYVRGIP